VKLLAYIFVVMIVSFLTCACGKKEEAKQSPAPKGEGYLRTVSKAPKRAEQTLELARVGEAIKLFEANEGRLPKSLTELVEKGYLESLPKWEGETLAYDPKTGELKLVNAGEAEK